MLENRSFDHMLGFLYPGKTGPNGQPFEGLLGTESNNGTDGKPVTVFQIDATAANAYFMPGADPGEGYANTNSSSSATGSAPTPPVATNSGFVTNFDAAITYDQRSGRTVIGGHDRREHHGDLPAVGPAGPVRAGERVRGLRPLVQLGADGDVPESRLRLRGHQPGSHERRHGVIHGAEHLRPDDGAQPAVEDLRLQRRAADRANYPDTVNAPETCFGKFADFQADAAAGTLPAYSFLEPSWGSTGNSQHPNYDVALGEVLIQQVYEALRDGPGWNQTLLIITYDEHGGCYDHVPPPSGATPPDNSVGEFGFDFTRFGVRVPGGAGLAADPGRDHLPGAGRHHADRPHVRAEDHRGALGPARADCARRGRA